MGLILLRKLTLLISLFLCRMVHTFGPIIRPCCSKKHLFICLINLLIKVNKLVQLNKCNFTNQQILLIVGAKLELIIMNMAQQIQDRTTVVKGVPVVEPSNEHFWFNRPQIILFLIHFTLFQVISNRTVCN